MKIFSGLFVAAVVLTSFAAEAQAGRRAYCDAYARDVANHKAGARQVVGGAVGGAVAGGVIGALIGGHHAVRTGIIAGGVTGGVLGGAHASGKWDKYYWRAYDKCRSW